MERATRSHDDWTLIRMETPDRPGGLAMLTRLLAACGVDILSIEVLSHRGGLATADVLVRGGDLDRALRALDADVRLLGRRTHGVLPDPGLAMAEACALVVDERTAEALLFAALRLVDAEIGAVYRVRPDGTTESVAETTSGLLEIAEQAAAAGTPVLSEQPAGSAVAIPVSEDDATIVVAVARAQTFPFQDAEIDRIDALSSLALRLLT
jgi:hypothetical protein